MTGNIMFSKLTNKEKEELYNFLLEYEIDYRNILDMKGISTFGMEIEVVSKEKYEERKNILIWLFANTDIHCSPSYDNWWLVNEFNLTTQENEYGYEIVSPILQDSKQTWKQIQETLMGIEKMNYYVNNLCASHVHFGIDLMDKKSIVNLLKIWALYEDILYRFSYGQYCNARPLISRYAKPISNNIRDILSILPEDTELLELLNELPLGHSTGINLSNYYDVLLKLKRGIKTIEIRCPNGTLDPIIWQNNINTFGKLLETIYFDNYDEEQLEYNFWNTKTPSYEATLNYSIIDFERALNFADLIFDKNIDKINFLRQYIKDGKVEKEGELQKTLTFTKKILHY